MSENKYVILAIRDGMVRGMVGIQDDEILRLSVAEWALDPTVTDMIRVPVELARKSFDMSVDDVRAALAKGGAA